MKIKSRTCGNTYVRQSKHQKKKVSKPIFIFLSFISEEVLTNINRKRSYASKFLNLELGRLNF